MSQVGRPGIRHRNIQRALLGAVLTCLALAAPPAEAARGSSPFLDYRSGSDFLPQSPSVTAGPVAGLFNPAAFALTDIGGADFWWNDGNIRDGLDNYGFGVGRTLNFAMNTTTYGTHAESYKIYDYQLGVAGGSRGHTWGLGYRWSHGETGRVARDHALNIGAASRLRNWLSLGTSTVVSLDSPAAQFLVDLGLRPFQKDFLTIYADWAVNDDEAFFQDGSWSAGLEVRPIRGVHLGFRARERADNGNLDYTALLGATVGFSNATAMLKYDEDWDDLGSTYLVRSNPPLRGLPTGNLILGKSRTYFPLSLENKLLTYQKYRWFDDKRVAWLDLLPLLNAVRDDTDLDIVAVNLAGFSARPSLLWEFRQKLLEIRASGKTVIVHTDRTNAGTYYLASAADSVSIDPLGSVAIPGIALSRSYLKGTLEKLGVGFQEHRYFKYKSAAEMLSRDSMSDADREQRQRIVDVIYETLRDGMAAGRGLDNARIDAATDEQADLTADEALAAGLVDIVSRWDALLKSMGPRLQARPDRKLVASYERRYWDEQWGRPVQIPVVYAVGACDMDTGIKGRETSAYLRSLIDDPEVKAVVLRADSPGGDPLPSDLVADAVRQLKAAGKPVIISQGDVAASGGYWISMDGTAILTTPLTITGSIGVISGWVWDDGFAAKLGITSDQVHRGAHADLYANVNLPFLGGIPRRPMTDDELARTEHVIRGMYQGFVDAVARGRGLTPAAVHAVAQGRVWMGGDAIERGLCDGFGSLDDAIQLARREAGIADWREVQITEYPPRQLFAFPAFGPQLPGLFGIGSRLNNQLARLAGLVTAAEAAEPTAALPAFGAPGLTAYDVDYLQALTRHRGEGALLVSPDLLPEDWQRTD